MTEPSKSETSSTLPQLMTWIWLPAVIGAVAVSVAADGKWNATPHLLTILIAALGLSIPAAAWAVVWPSKGDGAGDEG